MTMFHNILNVRYNILKQFENSVNEPFAQTYKEHANALLDIVQQSGEQLEGNIFFGHNHKDLDLTKLDKTLKKKRENLALFALSKSSILEIGFNSGFSTLLMLSANPNLKITSVDAGYHSYVQPCANYLKKIFGDRFTLVIGDSREVLPIYLCNNNNFDGYHIDGSHQESIAETDLCNIINTARNGSVICFDDANFPQLRTIITIYLLQGSVSHIFDPTYLNGNDQMFLKVNKNHEQDNK